MEVWLPSQKLVWDKALSEGEVLEVGRSLVDWQSAFVIPAYLQEQYPDLDSVEDLKDPQFKKLFQTAESPATRPVSCPAQSTGFARESNAAQIAGYGLESHVHIVNPGSGAALNADLYGAYERREPWLGYQWGTNDPALTLDPSPTGRTCLQRRVLVHYQSLRLRGPHHPHRCKLRPAA